MVGGLFGASAYDAEILTGIATQRVESLLR